MNLFRSEEHISAWQTEHGLAGETLAFDVARTWIKFIAKDRIREDYTHPRATGALGPFNQSLGLTNDFWKPRA